MVKKKGFATVLAILAIFFLATAAIFVKLQFESPTPTVEGESTITDLPLASEAAFVASNTGNQSSSSSQIASVGGNTPVDLSTLVPINVAGELQLPEVQKVQMQGLAGILEVTIEATGEGVLTQTGRADSVSLVFGSAGNRTALSISPGNTGLELVSGDTKATTDFTLIFSKATDQLVVDDPSGPRLVRIFPHQALAIAQTAMNGQMENMVLTQAAKGGVGDSLVYIITSKTAGNLLALFPISVESQTSVGAQSGLVVKVDEPFWLKFLSPLII